MREIKFRAWWKNEKYQPEGKMYFVGGLFFAKQQEGEPEYDMQKEVFEVGLMGQEVNSKIGWNNGNECILMQYTGLKDKNGKEIYEGDIVKNERYSLIKWPLEVRYHSELCQWVLGKDWPFVPISEIGNVNYLEVIGNIYENPELLK